MCSKILIFLIVSLRLLSVFRERATPLSLPREGIAQIEDITNKLGSLVKVHRASETLRIAVMSYARHTRTP